MMNEGPFTGSRSNSRASLEVASSLKRKLTRG
jgi:hypothetical protein